MRVSFLGEEKTIYADGKEWLVMQKAQQEAPAAIPRVLMVRSADVCEREMIHPVTKGPLASRIADSVWLYQK